MQPQTELCPATGPVAIKVDAVPIESFIDNMEGLGIRRASEGKIVFTLISGDNFPILQRTLLPQFKLMDK